MSDTNKVVQVSDTKEIVPEFLEEKEISGPGKMLREGREKLSLTQKDVAKRLNFRQILVENIENNNLDSNLSATFNRGYLRNYARLVNVNVDEVLAAFDAHGETKNNRSEMLSFSNLMVKETENSRLKWVSYLIIAILLSLTVLWWLQDSQQIFVGVSQIEEQQHEEKALEKIEIGSPSEKLLIEKNNSIKEEAGNLLAEPKVLIDSISSNLDGVQKSYSDKKETTSANIVSLALISSDNESLTESEKIQEVPIGHAIFTFSGDCWVNIYDATGERIAWGVKKSGYVMSIKGQPPLRITLGKPELATIVYNDQKVDLSSFNLGNIAKFTLPMIP